VAASILSQACSKVDSATSRNGTASYGPISLVDAAPSPEVLANRVLDALAADDQKALRSLRITRDEFCSYLWPEMPSSRIPNVECNWVWDQATLKSNAGLHEVLSSHRGKRYRLEALRFVGGIDNYRSYRVHKDPQLTVIDQKGSRRQLRFFGSLLELGGQYKLFSFVVD
jgi:hypothetical protein